MKLVLLGTTGYHPNARRQTACLMLPTAGIVLDAGTGMYRVGARIETRQLDIFLSHAHLDHVVGLTYLYNVLLERGVESVRVHGEAAKLAAVREHLFAELIFPAPPLCDFCPLEGPVELAAGGRVDWFPLVHPGGSLGYRLDWPTRSLAYVTDTTAAPGADYIERIRGVDLLVHECNFRDAQREWAEKTGHSYTSAVAQVAREAEVGRLLLVHFDPLDVSDDPVDLDAARQIFANTTLGADEDEIEF